MDTFDAFQTFLFALSAIALLGSPGPGIAALLAVGRAYGMAGSLPMFAGMQLGLALAAGATALGLFSVLSAFPGATTAMTLLATAYLVWLALRIANAPVAVSPDARPARASPLAGFMLGAANPKAYIAFASLFASRVLVADHPGVDAGLKWLVCMLVAGVVDGAWLTVGVAIGCATIQPRVERVMNLAFAAMILVAAGMTLFSGPWNGA